jgi:hypothetical protein
MLVALSERTFVSRFYASPATLNSKETEAPSLLGFNELLKDNFTLEVNYAE